MFACNYQNLHAMQVSSLLYTQTTNNVVNEYSFHNTYQQGI